MESSPSLGRRRGEVVGEIRGVRGVRGELGSGREPPRRGEETPTSWLSEGAEHGVKVFASLSQKPSSCRRVTKSKKWSAGPAIVDSKAEIDG